MTYYPASKSKWLFFGIALAAVMVASLSLKFMWSTALGSKRVWLYLSTQLICSMVYVFAVRRASADGIPRGLRLFVFLGMIFFALCMLVTFFAASALG